jgi:hypothetical protein
LHRDILDNFDFSRLPIASKAIAPLLWLLASEYEDGVIDASIEELAFRLRIDEKNVREGVKHLIDKGFFYDDSVMLAECLQDAIAEREKETEKERETKKEKETDSATTLLANFGITDQLSKDFIKHRKTKKAEITSTVMAGFQREADKAGISIIDAVRISIERNWQGFNAEWYQSKSATVNQKPDKLNATISAAQAFLGGSNERI